MAKVFGSKRAFGEAKYTKYNKINNSSENFREGKIGAKGDLPPSPFSFVSDTLQS